MADEGRYSGPTGPEEILRRPRPSPRQESSPRPTSGPARAVDASEEDRLVSRLSAASARLVDAAAGLVRSSDEIESRASLVEQDALANADAARRRLEATAGNHAAQGAIEHRSKAIDAISQLAPGPASLPWTDPGLLSYQPTLATTPQGLRLGHLEHSAGVLTNESVTVPWVLPFLDNGSITLVTEGRGGSDPAIVALLARLLASTLPGQVVVSWHDPLLRTVLSPLAALRSCGVLQAPMTEPNELEDHLAELTRTVTALAEQRGGTHPTLGSLSLAAGQVVAPYNILVLCDYPTGMTKRTQGMLLRLLEQGRGAGVHFIIQHQLDLLPAEDDIDVQSVHAHSATVALDAQPTNRWPSTISHLQAVVDPSPPAEIVEAVSDNVARLAADAAAPNLDFGAFLAPAANWWSESSRQWLSVTLGRSGVSTVQFRFGDSKDQLNNAVIGGAVGTGKSNVLMVMIHDLAVKYSPAELAFYLLDFKQGLEFSVLAPSDRVPYGLPHARVLGLESDRHLGHEVLLALETEFNRRAALFKQRGVKDLEAYRAIEPDDVLPRLLLMIDEFQVLIDGGDQVSDDSVRILEFLARQGRAGGIHLVLASQTLTGIQSLITKKDAILGQCPVRIALRTDSQESQVLLQQGNTAAADLRYRGQAIYNPDFGQPGRNQQLVIPYADPDRLESIRRDLWERRDPATAPHPFVFNGRDPADLTKRLLALNRGSAPTALAGMPVALSDQPLHFELDAEPGRHVALIGPGDPDHRELAGTLQATTLSAAASVPPGSVIHLVDLLTAPQRKTFQPTALQAGLRQFGHTAHNHQGRDAALQLLRDIQPQLALREQELGSQTRTLLVFAGLHNALGLEESPDIGIDAPIETLRRLVTDGPGLGFHIIGWWSTLASFQQQIDRHYSTQGLWHGFCLLRSPLADAQELIGHTVEWRPQPNRIVHFDRRTDDGRGQLGIPFAPLTTEQLSSLGPSR